MLRAEYRIISAHRKISDFSLLLTEVRVMKRARMAHFALINDVIVRVSLNLVHSRLFLGVQRVSEEAGDDVDQDLSEPRRRGQESRRLR